MNRNLNKSTQNRRGQQVGDTQSQSQLTSDEEECNASRDEARKEASPEQTTFLRRQSRIRKEPDRFGTPVYWS